MAVFRNFGVNLRDFLCDVPLYASAQSLNFRAFAKNPSFLDWKLPLVPTITTLICVWALTDILGQTYATTRLKQQQTLRLNSCAGPAGHGMRCGEDNANSVQGQKTSRNKHQQDNVATIITSGRGLPLPEAAVGRT